MKVKVIYRNDADRPLDDPLPETNRVVFRLIKGDVLRPLNGKWFSEPYPTRVLRFYCPIPLPFLAWRIGSWSGYIGAKVFVANDASFAPGTYQYPAYANWMKPEDLTPGSMAICPSLRPFAKPE